MRESKNAQSGEGHRADLQDQFSNARAYGGTFYCQATEEACVIFLLGYAGLKYERDGHILLADSLGYSSYWKSGFCTDLVIVQ